MWPRRSKALMGETAGLADLRLELLAAEAGRTILAADHPADGLAAVLRSLLESLKLYRISAWQLGAAPLPMAVYPPLPPDAALARRDPPFLSHVLARRVGDLAIGRSFIVELDDLDERQQQRTEASGVLSALALPLMADSGLYGVLLLESAEGVAFWSDPIRHVAGRISTDVSRSLTRTRVTSALNSNFSQLRSFLDDLDEVLWSVDLVVRRTIYLSPAAQRVFGRPLVEEDDWLQAVLEASHPEDRASIEQAHQAVLAGDVDSVDVEYRVVLPDGSVRTLQDRFRGVRDDTGTVVRLDGIVTDVTGLRRSEADVRRFAALAEHTPSAVLTLKPEGTVVWANSAARTMLGVPRGRESFGLRFADFLTDPGRPPLARTIFPAVLSGERWSGPVRLRHLDTGEMLETQLQIFRLQDGARDAVPQMVVIVEDERRRRRDQAQHERRLAALRTINEASARTDGDFRRLLENVLGVGAVQFGADLAVFAENDHGRFQIIASVTSHPDLREASQGFHVPANDSLCHHIWEADDVVDIPSIEHAADASLSSSACVNMLGMASVLGVTVSAGQQKRGSLVFASRSSRADCTEQLDLEFIRLVARVIGAAYERSDIRAELIRARDAAQAADRAKGEFLAMMSHEIRTPLNAVIGFTDLLEDTPLHANQRECVDTIRVSGQALMTLLNDILDFSKVEAGQLELEAVPFDVRRLLEEAVELYAPAAAGRDIDLIVDVQPNVPDWLSADPMRLRQILLNLLGNAVKFTLSGHVVVSAGYSPAPSPDGAALLHISVEDTGVGIEDERLDRLFKPFSQADTSTTRRFGGTGLGLAICRRLCNLMGGEIQVRSKPGLGSSFTCTVRVDLPNAVPAWMPTPSPDAVQILAGKSAVIVEQNAASRDALAHLLTRWGMRVATSGATLAEVRGALSPQGIALVDSREQEESVACPVVRILPFGTVPSEMELGVARPVKAQALRTALELACGATTAAAPEAPLARAPKLADEYPLRILIAEDNQVNQRVATLFLDKLGYRADVVDNGQEAVDRVRNEQYDVVLMDVHMPGMDGLSAARQIRRDGTMAARGTRLIYMIAVTADALLGERDRCLQAGMDEYMTKPLRIGELREKLREAALALEAGTPGKSIAAESVDEPFALK